MPVCAGISKTNRNLLSRDRSSLPPPPLPPRNPPPNYSPPQVGDGNTDHSCWQRPEDMTTDRTAYKVDALHPGSDLAGEAAAALAASALVFRSVNATYARVLLTHAQQLFVFADTYRGIYSDAIPNVNNFYHSYSGFNVSTVWCSSNSCTSSTRSTSPW